MSQSPGLEGFRCNVKKERKHRSRVVIHWLRLDRLVPQWSDSSSSHARTLATSLGLGRHALHPPPASRHCPRVLLMHPTPVAGLDLNAEVGFITSLSAALGYARSTATEFIDDHYWSEPSINGCPAIRIVKCYLNTRRYSH